MTAVIPVRRFAVAAIGCLALSVAGALPVAADQVSTATALQTTNGCVAGSGWNCSTYAGYPTVLNISVTSSDATIPTGTVTVYDSTVWGATGYPMGSVQLDNNGNAQFQGPPLSAGQHFLHATYAGDATHALSASYVLLMAVQLNYDQVNLYWSSNTSLAGQPITYSITVSSINPGWTPTGTVNLYDQITLLASATLIPDTGQWATTSRATIVYALTTVGTHYVYANYSGDSLFESNMSPSFPDITVTQATPSLSVSSSNPTSTVGQSVTLTAVLSNAAAPSGSFTFADGSTTLATVAISNGQASYTTSALAVGSHSITASYTGDANNAATTSPAFTQLVQQASTTTSLTSSINPSQYWYPVTLTATVSSGGPAPTGTVTFYDGSTVLGTVALGSNGRATLNVQNLGVGTHNLQAVFSGDTNSAPSSSPTLGQTVAQDTTTTTLSCYPTTVGRGKPVTCTAAVHSSYSPTQPAGTVTFWDGTTKLATVTLVNGTATFTTSSLAVGTHHITVTYSGSTTQVASTSAAVTVTITRH